MGKSDPARFSLIVVIFVGAVVLRALHDLPVSEFVTVTTSIITWVIGGGLRTGRKTDPVS